MIELWDFQEAAIDQLRVNIRQGIMNQILCAPTGSGKTIIALHLIRESRAKGKRCLFVCDRISLIDQTSLRLDEFGIPHGVIQGSHPRFQPWLQVQVASAQTLEKRGWPDDLDLIIIDEAHTHRKNVVQRLTVRETVCVGLTATPFTRGLGRLYDAVVSVTTTNKLIEENYLAPYRVYAPSEPNMDGAKVVAGEWTIKEQSTRAQKITGDCVQEYLARGEDRKFIAFGADVAHCEKLRADFLSAGIQANLYTYRTPGAERTATIREFRKDDSYIRGLISVAALARGFDVPDIGVVILARPLRRSLAEQIQMFGRGLRSSPGKQECLVLDHAGNCVRMWDDMQEFFANGVHELDDGKKRAKKNGKAEQRVRKCPKCAHVHALRPHCPECGYEYPRRSRVEQEAGELVELVGSHATPRESKQALYSMLLYVARQRGYKDGWAYYRYKERTKKAPRGLADVTRRPTPAVLSWIRSRDIAAAKVRAKPTVSESLARIAR